MQFLKVTYERPSQAGEDHFIVREHGMYEIRVLCACGEG